MLLSIDIGARKSNLSRAQVSEIFEELKAFHPEVSFSPIWVETTGDRDLSISLRDLEKTDFFTKEIDALLLSLGCRIAIHSAKDLPEPLPEGMMIVALTKGVDPRDALVFNKELPQGAIIGISSERREKIVRELRGDLRCVDIRGTIEMRLDKLDRGEIDGLVVAEAALIRLKLDRKRMTLPGNSAPFQGKLAVLARDIDVEMQQLFSCLDTRTKYLYLGSDPTHFQKEGKVVHYPVIKMIPRKIQIDPGPFTHIIFTSKNAVKEFFHLVEKEKIKDKKFIAIGKITASHLRAQGIEPYLISEKETQEGLIEHLKNENLKKSYLLLPRSSLSRPVLTEYFEKEKINYLALDLYDTTLQCLKPVPKLEDIDAIVFTSPSTVDGFFQIYSDIPKDKELITLGPITEEKLSEFLALYKTKRSITYDQL